jgi:mono/diheme cytochrome c family protein
MDSDFPHPKKSFAERDVGSPQAENGGLDDTAIQDIHAQLLREKEEPTEGFSPIPIFLIFIFGALMFWGGIYLATHSGGFRKDVFDPNWKPTAEVAQVAAFDPFKQGKKLYTRTCQQCHQVDGKGIPGVYPPLSGSPWVNGSHERAAKILILGLSGPITVGGNEYNGNMPPVGTWSDRDIAAVLTYVRSSFDNSSGAVTEADVKSARAAIGGKTTPWDAEELLKIHPLES